MSFRPHLATGAALETRQADEGFLLLPAKFQKVEGEYKKMDGSYLVWDIKRNIIIRVGKAEATLLLRWGGHRNGARLGTSASKKSTFYSSYPLDVESPVKKGSFQDLVQSVGIGFVKDDKQQLVDLFEWTPAEEMELRRLSKKGGNLATKKCRHISCLCECFYAVAVKPSDNLSCNPSCEWQLRYYGNE